MSSSDLVVEIFAINTRTDQPCKIALLIDRDEPHYGLSFSVEGEFATTWQSACEPDVYLTDLVLLGNLLRASPKLIDQYFDFSLWVGPKYQAPWASKAPMMASESTKYGLFVVSGLRPIKRKQAHVRLEFLPKVSCLPSNRSEERHIMVKITPEEAERAGFELLAIVDELIEKHDVNGIWWRKFGREKEPKIVEESEGKYPMFELPPEEESSS